MKLAVATCQFPVDRDIRANLGWIKRQMNEARSRGAHVAHFPECCLTGYAPIDFKSFAKYDWDLLATCTQRVMALACELGLWVILGSSHRLTGSHKPHNSLYVIDDRGRLLDRYDKRFCTGDYTGKTGDLAHYTPGDHFVTFKLRGVRCGLLICHDARYDELYRAYKRLGVQLMFHSFHNGHTRKAMLRRWKNIWGVIVPPTMQTYAANNFMWISANNTTRRESCWPSFLVRPDGVIAGRLVNHRASILVSIVDTNAKLYDASEAWRDRALNGIFNSGTIARDERSRARQSL